MKKLKFARLLAVSALLTFAVSGAAQAVNYTAIKDKGKTEEKAETGKKEEVVCTAQDKSNIKKYTRAVEDYTEIGQEVADTPGIHDDRRKREKMGRKLEKFNEFVMSEEFEELKKSFKNCDVDPPLGPIETPYWTP